MSIPALVNAERVFLCPQQFVTVQFINSRCGMAYEKEGVIYIEEGDTVEDIMALCVDDRSQEEIAEAARRREALIDRFSERIDAERAVEIGEVDIH